MIPLFCPLHTTAVVDELADKIAEALQDSNIAIQKKKGPHVFAEISNRYQEVINDADKPQVIKYTIKRAPSNKRIVYILISGRNLIGKNVPTVSKDKSKTNKKQINSSSNLTRANLNNINIEVIKSIIRKQNTELVVIVKLPIGYKGGDEGLTISTPAGQTSLQIKLPRIKE